MTEFRDYAAARDSVKECYRNMRAKQDLEFVKRQERKYSVSATCLTPWEALESLNCFVDLSDPDIELPNLSHLYQTAEAIRRDGLPDWMQLTGFIHDLGKCIYLRGCDTDGTSMKQQWSIVGDTFIVGDPLPDALVHPEFNELNSNYNYNCNIYDDGCGLDACHVSYGHDEYLYQVLVRSGHQLPDKALWMIRYHSLYAWHTHGCYLHLESTKDKDMKPWVQLFNKYDLYTKENTKYTETELKDMRIYYDRLLKKYLPDLLHF